MNNPITIDQNVAFSFYPSVKEIDQWVAKLLLRSQKLSANAGYMDYVPMPEPFGNGANALMNRYVHFTMDNGHSFYGYWQPALKTPAPLLINLPGYGGWINMHPQINDDGYHILHISPLGYVTPTDTRRDMLMENGVWPVLHHTATGQEGGYEDWLTDCLVAISWARQQPGVLENRVSLFGTSQGGGGALLLVSILQNDLRCVCADLPFLTGFPMTRLQGDAYGILQKAYATESEGLFWNRLGYIDTLSHAHRITIPTMLSGGGEDTVCPPSTIEALFHKLHCTKQYSYISSLVHTQSRESMFLFRTWLALYS